MPEPSITDYRRISLTVGLAVLLCTTACSSPPRTAIADTTVAGRGDANQHDHVHGYAMAYCLRSLGSKGLPEPDARVVREKGDRWTQVVVERSTGDVGAFFAMIPVIDSAIAATPMAFVKDEASAGSVPAPVYFCAEIIRQPAVARAMASATVALDPAAVGR